MKILHLLSQIPDSTGSGKYVQEMIKQTLQSGHDAFLVAGVPDGFSLNDTPLGGIISPGHCLFVHFENRSLDFKVVGMSDVMPYPSTVCSHLKEDEISSYLAAFETTIKQAVDRFRPDIIHSNHLWMASCAARRAAPEIPLVTTCHGTCLRQHRLCPELGRSLLAELSGIDRVIALFNQQKSEIINLLNLPEERIATISGGFNELCFYTESTGIRTESETIHLLYAGKLNRSKGVPWLLRSLIKLHDLNFHLHLVGGGSGPEKKECLELAAQLGDKVTVHGVLSHQELGELMRYSHIFVLPSFYEGLPLVLLEALACGCRIITTDLPGVRELFSNYSANALHMVPLPPMQTVDTPTPEGEHLFEKRLRTALEDAINTEQAGNRPENEDLTRLTAPYRWSNIFGRILKVYEQAILFKTDGNS